jgi:hypothetical protein
MYFLHVSCHNLRLASINLNVKANAPAETDSHDSLVSIPAITGPLETKLTARMTRTLTTL